MRTCASPVCSETFEPNSWNQKYHDLECKQFVKNRRRRSTTTISMNTHVNTDTLQKIDYDKVDHMEFLRKENKRLENLYRKHKYNREEQIQAVYDAVHDVFSRLDIPRVTPPKLPGTTNSEEFANPYLSDWQLGKITPTYNTSVARERISLFADKVIEITEVQRSDHPVNHVHIGALGDMVEGEDIFPGQSFQIHTSLYQQMVDGMEMGIDFVRRMLSYFETVHFTGVIGNHGLLSSKRRGQFNAFNPETNMDRLLYKFIAKYFEDDPRVTFNIPDGSGETSFYAVDYMGDYGVLMMHGDQLSQPTSLHSYYKKILGWKDTGIPEEFNDVIIGHWHQNTKATFGTVVLRIAGTPESDNTYAQERLGVMGRPSQHLQFVHPKRGVTAEYDVYLD